MGVKKIFKLRGKVWKYTVEPASWYFVYVDSKMAEEVRKNAVKTVGFRYVPVEVTVGKTTWKTTLFPTKEKKYLIAMKAAVRKAEGIFDGDMVSVTFRIL